MGYGYQYDPVGTRPASGPQPGTVTLQAFIVGEFDEATAPADDVQSLGIFNARDVCGNPWPDIECTLSVHAEGRAGDSGVPVVRPAGHPEGHRIAAFLTAEADALGIQQVIWAARSWRSDRKLWVPYTGRSDHFDHNHWEQCREAATTRPLTLAVIRAAFDRWLAGSEPAPPPPHTQESDDMRHVLVNPPAGHPDLVAGGAWLADADLFSRLFVPSPVLQARAERLVLNAVLRGDPKPEEAGAVHEIEALEFENCIPVDRTHAGVMHLTGGWPPA